MKVLCIGDSLSLPGHGNVYEDTWLYKLKQKYPSYDFISFFKRRLTTDVLNTMGGGDAFEGAFPIGADCLEHYMPHIVIIQLGIVDCAPRLINDKSLIWKIVRRLPKYFTQKYILYLKNNKKRDPKNVLVSEDKFTSNLKKYFNRCATCGVEKLFFIAIPYPGNEMIEKNPDIITNSIRYNQILKETASHFSFISLIETLNNKQLSKDIYDDGYHPSPKGNNLIYADIVSILEK
jgi:acyl-CoA thioesterase I